MFFNLKIFNFEQNYSIYKTPLHYASKFGHLENVKLLLDHKNIMINPQVISNNFFFFLILIFYKKFLIECQFMKLLNLIILKL